MNVYDEIKSNLKKIGAEFAEVSGDVDFGNRVIHAFEKYYWGIGNDLQGMRGYDIGAGKGSALIAALALGAEFVVGIDRSFDEFAHDGYTKMSWNNVCTFYGVDASKSLLIQGDIPRTTFKKGTFNFVSLIDVIEHVPDPKEFINYSIDHLSEGGILVLDTCPLFYSSIGHHLFTYFNTRTECWAHLKSNFEQAVTNHNVDSWCLDRYRELNKCTYEDIKAAISNHVGTYLIDICPVNAELLELYELNKSSMDPEGTYGAELLCRDWVSIVWQKNSKVRTIPRLNHPKKQELFLGKPSLEKIVSQSCTASQFLEDHYIRLAQEINQKPRFHRKQWEYIYILRALELFGLLKPNRVGLGFGCGKEPLAVVMAKHGLNVMVTDIPPLLESDSHWGSASAMDLYYGGICSEEQYAKHVSFRAVDMNNIPNDLEMYDFIWSCCALEHLGSLKAGIDFILNSTKCLKPGGVAIHTTELNLTSDIETLESPSLSLYRRLDMLDLQNKLVGIGCSYLPMNFYTGDQPEDKHIDLPPYKQETHLKLLIDNYEITSFGLILKKNMELK